VPANTGRDGALLDVWELAAESGKRAGDEPLPHFEIPASGDWGPVTVEEALRVPLDRRASRLHRARRGRSTHRADPPDKYYEFVLSSETDDYQHHFMSSRSYAARSSFACALDRLTLLRMNSNLGDGHAAIVVSRMREWTKDDVLEVSTQAPDGDQEARNVISEASDNKTAIYLQDDAATPGESSLELLPWFPEQAFQTGVDVFMPVGRSRWHGHTP
jgi:hypothetical protein